MVLPFLPPRKRALRKWRGGSGSIWSRHVRLHRAHSRLKGVDRWHDRKTAAPYRIGRNARIGRNRRNRHGFNRSSARVNYRLSLVTRHETRFTSRERAISLEGTTRVRKPDFVSENSARLPLLGWGTQTERKGERGDQLSRLDRRNKRLQGRKISEQIVILRGQEFRLERSPAKFCRTFLSSIQALYCSESNDTLR